MKSVVRRLGAALLVVAACVGATPPSQSPLVLAAASLQESLTAAGDAWARQGHMKPAISFAASSALARQVQAGADADLFVSADEEWMDVLDKRGLLAPGTRRDLVANRLVIVASAASHGRVPAGGAALARVLSAGPLAMADPGAVPAGKYGKAALQKLGAWDRVAPRVVRAENVRAALALVERGVAPYGIVYATDALASKGVRVAGVFPVASYPRIVYPVARLKTSTNPEAEGFRRFLLSQAGRRIMLRYGFYAL